jgi:hypothetical protein
MGITEKNYRLETEIGRKVHHFFNKSYPTDQVHENQ